MTNIESLLGIWNRPNINWRRKFKWILKEISRQDISSWQFQVFLHKIGIYGTHYDFVWFLQTEIRGRTFHRLYKAAQKQGKVLPMRGFWACKDKDFRKISFMLKDKKFIYSAEIKKTEIRQVEDGRPVYGASYFAPLHSVFSFTESNYSQDGLFVSLEHVEETIKEVYANTNKKKIGFTVFEQKFGLGTKLKTVATMEFYPDSGELHIQPVLL